LRHGTVGPGVWVFVEVPTNRGVNQDVAGAQVGLPSKQPGLLQGKLKGSQHFVL